jgi:hypothetical protein
MRCGLAVLALLCAAGPAVALAADAKVETTALGVKVVVPKEVVVGANLVPNPDFKKGAKGLEFWQTEYLEGNETKYSANHLAAEVVPAPDLPGKKAILFTVDVAAAASQGIKAQSALIRIVPDRVYEFGANVKSSGCACKVFLEGYVEDPEQKKSGSDQIPGFSRLYRSVLHVAAPPGQWGVADRVIDFTQVKERYRPTHLLVKLYAYWPAGQVYYTDVFLQASDKTVTKKYGVVREKDRPAEDGDGAADAPPKKDSRPK